MRVKKSRRYLGRPGILIAAVCGLLLVGIAAYAGFLTKKANDAITRISAPGGNSGCESVSAEDKAAAKPILFLIAGVDNREGGGGSMNTDVMMLVALDPEKKAATVLSLPRDVQLKPEKLTSQKANYYYAYYYNKDKTSAITNTKTFFSDLFRLPIDYMAIIDFDGFRKLVDALGGLQIDVDMNMKYVDEEDGTDIDLKKGVQLLNGKKTLDFVRYRKSNMGTAESSDLARNERQHQVVSKLLDKLTSLGGITQWGNVLDIAGESVKTDVPEPMIRDWITQFRKMKPEQIDFVPLEGKWDSPYIVPTEKDMAAALNAIRERLGLSALTDSSALVKVIGLERTDSRTVTTETYR
ncbi:LCP family protein [Paenibacillus ginsengarvi]|uniref:LytR family transcriptional regulator n=1 Tax=Paenibacillus ginsengarvi TaxID=400777 RepID=A0A3B0CJL4_9BACL|nr:LCP family protein [Paenibacillus ginsengarvi]RKN84459.1 LytR family transcriptional regulator [Paenibacillus ginsengarvi]